MEGNASRRELLENIGSFVNGDDFGLEGDISDIEDEVFDYSPSITLNSDSPGSSRSLDRSQSSSDHVK